MAFRIFAALLIIVSTGRSADPPEDQSVSRMKEIRSQFQSNPNDDERIELIGEIVALMKVVQAEKDRDEHSVDFDKKFAPTGAMIAAIASIRDHKSNDEVWEILTKIYTDYPEGPEILYHNLAPALVQTRLLALVGQDDSHLANLQPVDILKAKVPKNIRKLPGDLQKAWQLATTISNTVISIPESSKKTERINYHDERDTYYSLMAKSVATSNWEDASSITSCGWGNLCGTGIENFSALQYDYRFLTLLERRTQKDGVAAALINTLFNTDPESWDSSFQPQAWKSSAFKKLKDTKIDWQTTLAGMIIFNTPSTRGNLFYGGIDPKVIELLCKAVLVYSDIPDSCDLSRLATIITNSDPCEDRELTGKALKVLIDDRKNVFGVEQIEKYASRHGFDNIKREVPDKMTWQVRILVNGVPFSNQTITSYQRIDGKSRGTGEKKVKTDDNGDLTIDREVWTRYDDDLATLSLLTDYDTKQTYGKGWTGVSPDKILFSITRTASDLATDNVIQINTRKMIFDLKIPESRKTISQSGPTRMNIYYYRKEGTSQSGYTQIEFPPGKPVVLESIPPGCYESYLSIPGCAIVSPRGEAPGEEDATIGPIDLKPGHRIVWDHMDKEDAYLFLQYFTKTIDNTDPENPVTTYGKKPYWRQVSRNRFSNYLGNLEAGTYRIEFRKKHKYYRKGAHLRTMETTIKETDPHVINLDDKTRVLREVEAKVDTRSNFRVDF